MKREAKGNNASSKAGQKTAANQNRRTKTNMGTDEGTSGRRTSSSRKESSDSSKVRTDQLFKKSRSKDEQDELVKSKKPMTSILKRPKVALEDQRLTSPQATVQKTRRNQRV